MKLYMRTILLMYLIQPTTALAWDSVKSTDSCGFGLLAWCFWQTASGDSGPSGWRTEVFTGYKFGMRYYEKEESSCLEQQDCDFVSEGVVYGVDLFRNLSGNNRSSDYLDVGMQYSQIPVASWNSDGAFEGALDSSIEAGVGSLNYHFLRLAVKRSHFLYFIHSKYLISSFGAGFGIPESKGAAEDFVGSQKLVPSIGGKLGFQVPLNRAFDIGVASNWSVLWFGSSIADSAFIAGYGLNVSAWIR